MKTFTVDSLIEIAIALSAEKRIDALLGRILDEAMGITNCDGGTVYIRNGDFLMFHNVVTLSKNYRMVQKEGEKNILPPVPLSRMHVCACAAMDGESFNIPDVYMSERFDFSGAQKYDSLNGYRTRSMLVIPMEDDKGNNIGVLQLINAMDARGNVIPFDPSLETIISALASLASVSLNNNLLSKAVLDILHSLVEVMVDAIDARTPYNANHTRSMVRYAKRFIEWLDATDNELKFKEEETDPFLMSVWLHDIGKLVVPLEIMDKPTRLGGREREIMHRIETAILMERIRGLSNPSEAEDAAEKTEELIGMRETIKTANTAGFLPDETVEKLKAIADTYVLASDGSSIKLLDPEETEMITVRKGTLTTSERAEMERHAVYTERFLSKIKFRENYADVPKWASGHHEFLNGTGYPHALSASELPKQTRIITILDIYDALTAEDRPYKPPMTPEKAFGILQSMCDEGKLDGRLLSLFRESGAWRRE